MQMQVGCVAQSCRIPRLQAAQSAVAQIVWFQSWAQLDGMMLRAHGY
jgi:hypothetical protein